MTNKKKWLIAVGVLLACVLAVVLSMPRFYTGDRIKLTLFINNADMNDLDFTVQTPMGQTDDFKADVSGLSTEISAKADEYGRYSVIIEGAEKPVELRIMKYDWFQRTDVNISIDMINYYYLADNSTTKGELPIREKNHTEGYADMEDGRYVIYL
ncbi:hypothetical protein [uncultured Ruminococcus sp.]|uniref:hypothetical protein n=1 Tax=uncultured Ruminococcus sp. TaxID=165186 RepID=UPI0025E300E3|nr:hypothetical protein [uncultured Ruminococcus sp.]